MTRADELLAEVRRCLADPEQQGTALWYAARELDDFMSAFGLLPAGWQVPIAAVERQGAHIEVPSTAVDKMAEVIEAAVARMCGMEAHPKLPGRMASVAARAVADAIVQEHQQAVATATYWAIYGEYERAKALAEPVNLTVDPGGRIRKTTDAVQNMRQSFCTRSGPHGMHYLGTSGLVCHGKQHGAQI